jgi:hypothetical protein
MRSYARKAFLMRSRYDSAPLYLSASADRVGGPRNLRPRP